MWLKRRTPQNIVIGGAAGALPPLVGWAAVTGDVGWGGIALFAIIFFWTPPHFWALSLYRAGEYEAAGVPMLPVVAGPRETKRQMLIYTLVMWLVARAAVFSRHLRGLVYPAWRWHCSALIFTRHRDPGFCATIATARFARHMFSFLPLHSS